MREHRSLRPARCAGRVTHERGVVVEHVRRLASGWGGGHHLLVRRPDLEHHPDRAGPGRRRVADQHARARVSQHVLDLVGRQAEVDRDRHRAEPVACEECLQELDAVVQQQRDAISGLHAVAGEDRGDPGGAIVKLGVRSGVVAEYHREMVRTRSARPARELGQRQPA